MAYMRGALLLFRIRALRPERFPESSFKLGISIQYSPHRSSTRVHALHSGWFIDSLGLSSLKTPLLFLVETVVYSRSPAGPIRVSSTPSAVARPSRPDGPCWSRISGSRCRPEPIRGLTTKSATTPLKCRVGSTVLPATVTSPLEPRQP